MDSYSEGNVKKTGLRILYAVVISLAINGRAGAGDIGFRFAVPLMPFPPKISSISNSSAVMGGNITVYASITGELQKKVCCGTPCNSRTDCELSEWYMEDDTDVSPNPPCIPNPNGDTGDPGTSNPDCVKAGNPTLWYYINNDVANAQSVQMVFDAPTKKFKGLIPTGGFAEGDIPHYYIIASDSRGNVISMLPDKNTAACKSVYIWDSKYETPATDNCSVANGYEECSKYKSGTPACGNAYTINDPQNDTCGKPDANGEQIVQTGQGPLDILGFSVSAGEGYTDLPGTEVVCAKMGIGGAPPISGGAIDIYIMSFYNPDISDPNPADIYMPNLFTITYSPEASGADPNLVKVLWDGECITNPNTSTADMLSRCKAVVGNESESKLKIGYGNGSLKFIAQNEVITYTGKRTIIGANSKQTRMEFTTGQINFTGGTPFWTTDQSTGMTLAKDTKSLNVCAGCDPVPASPIVVKTTCKANGVGSASSCPKGQQPALSNQCVVEFAQSPDASFASNYRIYHSKYPGAETNKGLAELLGDVAKTETSYTYDVTNLDGSTHYFFMTSVSGTGVETSWPDAAPPTKSTCRVEDWTAPLPPVNFSCSTPPGNEKKCSCTWTPPADDPSVAGYEVKVKDVANNTTRTVQENTAYSFVDDSGTETEPLVNGSTYEYSVRAIDFGDNRSDWATANCVPEDKKAPAQVDSLSISRGTSDCTNVKIKASWEPCRDDDVAGYNLYACIKYEGIDCETKNGSNGGNGFSKLNGGLIPQAMDTISFDATVKDDRAFIPCFYVETCDASGNCSDFSTLHTYRKCMKVMYEEHLTAPLWPLPQTCPPENPDCSWGGKELKATPLPEGNGCKLEWNRICNGEGREGDFNDKCDKCPQGGCNPNPCSCDYPDNLQLSGYKVMRSTSSIVPTLGDAIPVLSLGTSGNPTAIDYGLTNETTYYYRVYGIDGSCLFSRAEPVPEAVACTPKIDLDPCDVTPLPAECSIKIDIGFNIATGNYFKRYELQPCKYATDSDCLNNQYKRVENGIEGITVELYDVTKGMPVSARITNASGTFNKDFFIQGSQINATHDYKVRARIPAAEISGNTIFANQCVNTSRNPATDDCIVDLTKEMKLSSTRPQTIRAMPIAIPSGADGFGGDIGNANCDGKVNINDLAAIKFAYNTKRGDACYRAWADFNADGKVNIDDLAYIKNNYNKMFGSGNMSGAKLCASTSATDGEMKPLTGTCCDRASPLYPCSP